MITCRVYRQLYLILYLLLTIYNYYVAVVVVLKLKGQVVTAVYRFAAKNREWVWLRMSGLSFLNPYTESVEYIVCTNSYAG